MFWVRFWSYLMGYLNLIIEGPAVEKIINMAVSRGIYLWDIRWTDTERVELKARVSSFKALKHIARRAGGRLRIQEKMGFPFTVLKMRRRQTMVLGALICITVLYILSSFVWFIDIKGNENISSAEILKSAEEAGLYSGTAKWKLDNSEVERYIRNDIPKLSWVGIQITGTKVTIRVAEKVVPPIEDNRPANVVAQKTGLVKEVLVLTGVAVTKEGSMVQKGDLLISGVIKTEVEPPESDNETSNQLEEEKNKIIKTRFVRAKGIVKGRVWYEGYGESAILNRYTVRTGDVYRSIMLKLGDNTIFLKGNKSVPFENYIKRQEVKTLPQWRNIKFPVEIVTTYFYKTKTVEEKISYAEAKKKALEMAKNQIKQELPKEYKVLNQKVHIINTNEHNLVRVKVDLETLEDLGEVKPLTEQEMEKEKREFSLTQPDQEGLLN